MSSRIRFSDFQISNFRLCWIGNYFRKRMLVRYRGINNKGVLERPWTKWKVLMTISFVWSRTSSQLRKAPVLNCRPPTHSILLELPQLDISVMKGAEDSASHARFRKAKSTAKSSTAKIQPKLKTLLFLDSLGVDGGLESMRENPTSWLGRLSIWLVTGNVRKPTKLDILILGPLLTRLRSSFCVPSARNTSLYLWSVHFPTTI